MNSAEGIGYSGTAASLVRIEALEKRYGRSAASSQLALGGIDLDVARGEFISLIGPSGCGKTTLLRILADLESASAGRISIDGLSAAEARRERRYGYVFQAPTLLDWRTALGNVMLPLRLLGWSRTEARRIAGERLAQVGLAEASGRYPWQLSGGQQQRVSIARALSLDPELLLMDEPFGALDEITRERMNQDLHALWRRTGKTVVFVTHSIAEAVFLSTRIAVMQADPGRIARIIDVDLPASRDFGTRDLPRFHELVTQVHEGLHAAYHA
ncbi:sulfonate ABC transporter ATP-binding protein [Acidihalobacter yilgarnensis]|uniref:Sulfonate ABC transporter ATP-binding protein n=1 Tax=Acidihalobacter yilgarnensis TaxID=2819280 RepID=A0A1D8IKI5_9GAMM|nr:ABC transporter ATP-binding protein [Acidihalobacter yilgarnensis]AOU96972.1 sulfonate ABC transporter ATP-binding protein [Acidihalobacter yilgarnensis]